MLHGSMDALVANSRAVVAQLTSEGVPENKIKLIYNGVDMPKPLTNRGAARRALGLDQHALIIVVVANLIHYKGHRDLLRGLGQVARQLPSPWRLLVVGRDEGLRSNLEGVARNEGIADNIQFLGQRPDALRFLAAADFGVLTSHEEGFSNVIIESMAAGLAMVVTSVGGNPDAVIEERTGLLIPPRDPAAIGQAVLRLARDPNLRKALGDAGRSRVEREFSIDRCVRAHHDLYQTLLAKRYTD
jgi:glycosyltransferase involved in cell wall biosynthesis